MKKIRLYFISVISIVAFIFANNQINVNVIEQDMNHVIIQYTIDEFEISDINLKDQVFHNISISDEPKFIVKGSPELSHINRSLIIPELSSLNAVVEHSEYSVYNNMNILPSKGNITRNFNINEIPYIKGEIYNINADFPGNLFELHDPYILRDFRGQVIQVNPLQYNPVTKELKVYNNITIRIDLLGQILLMNLLI